MYCEKNTHFKGLIKVLVCNVILNVTSIPITIFTASAINKSISLASVGDVKNVLIQGIIIVLLNSIYLFFRSVVSVIIQKYQLKTMNSCRVRFIDSIFARPIHELHIIHYGEINEILNNDIDEYFRLYTELIPNIITGVIVFLGYSFFVANQNLLVSVTLVSIALIQLFPPFIVKKYMQINYDDCREIEAKITDHIKEAIDGFEVIKLYNLKNWWISKLDMYQKQYLKIGNKSNICAAGQEAMYKLMDCIIKYGTYILIGVYVVFGYCGLDAAAQSIYLASEIYGSVRLVSFVLSRMVISNRARHRLRKNIIPCEHESSIAYKTNSACLHGTIQLNNLRFKKNNRTIINEINYRFSCDKIYLITGQNGVGKTTLLNLVAGFIRPNFGSVVFTTPKERTQNMFFYVPQQDPAYNITANMLFSMINKNNDKELRDKLYNIAYKFGLSDKEMDENLISELSGGERKKVFLSLGFALQDEWLFLDEPTNNLDSYSKKTLIELIRGRSGMLIVSHDKDLMSISENVLTLKESGLFYEN